MAASIRWRVWLRLFLLSLGLVACGDSIECYCGMGDIIEVAYKVVDHLLIGS